MTTNINKVIQDWIGNDKDTTPYCANKTECCNEIEMEGEDGLTYCSGCGRDFPDYVNEYYNQALADLRSRIPELEEMVEKHIKEKLEQIDDQNDITQTILGAMEYRGFYDCGKFLDPTIWYHIKPIIIKTLTSKE